jgi:hypothetical protein
MSFIFGLAAMMRVVINVLPSLSVDPSIIEDTDGIQLKVYRHSFQIKKRSYFFLIRGIDEMTPTNDAFTAQ